METENGGSMERSSAAQRVDREEPFRAGAWTDIVRDSRSPSPNETYAGFQRCRTDEKNASFLLGRRTFGLVDDKSLSGAFLRHHPLADGRQSFGLFDVRMPAAA